MTAGLLKLEVSFRKPLRKEERKIMNIWKHGGKLMMFSQRVEVPSPGDREGPGKQSEGWTSPWKELRNQPLFSPKPWL